MNLLPKHRDEFRSKEYWDSFFAERGDKAFEWYGSYRDLRGLCLRHLGSSTSAKNNLKILMIGCGNSSFSGDLYDSGFTNIVNIDFSETLIEHMIANNLAQRPLMRWEVMDMTALTLPDNSFDIVFDKGALDALMSDNETEILQKASSMFSEIDRVLVPGGKYICVSLCEDYIIAHLLQSFLTSSTAAYSVSVEISTPATRSPFKPFFLVLTKPMSAVVAPRSSTPSLLINTFFDSFGSSIKTSTPLSMSEVQEKILCVHSFTQRQFKIGTVEVGRYEIFDLYAQVQQQQGSGGGQSAVAASTPRFSIIIYDHAIRAERSCAVFFVPPGRETDFQFTSESGLGALASQAQCRRLLAVRCNRPHVFPGMTELQSELSPIAMFLAPSDTGPPDEDRIPYLAVQEENDWESIEQGVLEVAGSYVVEEMSDDAADDKYVWRRLVFLDNQHFIQTEAKLLYPTGSRAATGKKKKGCKSKGKAKSKTSSSSEGVDNKSGGELLFDHSYLDDHHKAMLVSLLCDNTSIISAGSSHLKSPNASDTGTSSSEAGGGVNLLLVGLGGGALAMALQKYLPSVHLDVVDLVPGLDLLAAKHFGLVVGPRCRIIVNDGVKYIMDQGHTPSSLEKSATNGKIVFTAESLVVENIPATRGVQYHSIVLDVDSKDNSLGLSAPPPEFLTSTFLNHLHDVVLLPGGSLCVNVVARDKKKLNDLILLLKSIFCIPLSADSSHNGKVYILKPSSETVNITVHAVKRISPDQPLDGLAKQLAALVVAPSSNRKSKAVEKNGVGAVLPDSNSSNNKSKIARDKCLDKWLADVKLSSDQLGLREIMDLISEA